MNMTSPIHSCWNAEYTNIMTVSNFETQGRTNSCYNSFKSRELYFHYNDFEMCNYSNWNSCNVSKNMYETNIEEYFSYAEPESHASLLLNGFDQKNDAKSIQNQSFGNETRDQFLGFTSYLYFFCSFSRTIPYPVVHNESSSSENLNYPEEYEYNFDSSVKIR